MKKACYMWKLFKTFGLTNSESIFFTSCKKMLTSASSFLLNKRVFILAISDTLQSYPSLPPYSIIFAVVAASAPQAFVFIIYINSIDRAAGAVAKSKGVAHFLQLIPYGLWRGVRQ